MIGLVGGLATLLLLPVFSFALCSWLVCALQWHRYGEHQSSDDGLV